MTNKYTRITSKERIEIASLLKAGKTKNEIAKILNRNKSTIGREIKRNLNGDGIYTAKDAKILMKKRRHDINQKLRKIKNNVRTTIIRKLNLYWSPEQISGWLKRKNIKISHEAIYQFVYEERRDLKEYLRCRKGKYRRRRGTRKRCKERDEAKVRRIDKRPSIVETRSRIGDWEGDTVRGKDNSGSILTLVERKSGLLMARKLEKAKAESVKEETLKGFEGFPKKKIQTITFDNGSEFALHELIERGLKTKVYFAYPYHSWERGTNENTNGLLRQFFPKGTSLEDVSQEDVDKTVKLLNHRPRKRLNYKSPAEVFSVALET
jgi:transposase, IS30 family